MNTPQAQIKLNLPLPLKDRAESQASKFGVPLATYLKHLIMKDTEDIDYPVFQASARTERLARQAMKEYKEGRTIRVDNVDKFFKEL